MALCLSQLHNWIKCSDDQSVSLRCADVFSHAPAFGSTERSALSNTFYRDSTSLITWSATSFPSPLQSISLDVSNLLLTGSQFHLLLEEHELGKLFGGRLSWCLISYQNSVDLLIPVLLIFADHLSQTPRHCLIEVFCQNLHLERREFV